MLEELLDVSCMWFFVTLVFQENYAKLSQVYILKMSQNVILKL